MLSEKALCRNIREAFKNGHYDIACYAQNDKERIAIISPWWIVDTYLNLLPRKALALIVEHAGYIPQNNNAIQLSKERGTQHLIVDTAMIPLWKMLEQIDTAKGSLIHKTRLTWDGCEVWQKEDTLEVKMFDGDFLKIADSQKDDHDIRYYENMLVFDAGAELLAVMPMDFPKDEIYLSHLSGMQWTGGKEKE